MGAADASFGFAAKRTLASGADAHFKTTGGGACELAHVSVSSNKKKCLGCESIDLRWNIKTRFIKLSIPQNHPDPQTLFFSYSDLIFQTISAGVKLTMSTGFNALKLDSEVPKFGMGLEFSL